VIENHTPKWLSGRGETVDVCASAIQAPGTLFRYFVLTALSQYPVSL
jgi:hypothetical protein